MICLKLAKAEAETGGVPAGLPGITNPELMRHGEKEIKMNRMTDEELHELGKRCVERRRKEFDQDIDRVYARCEKSGIPLEDTANDFAKLADLLDMDGDNCVVWQFLDEALSEFGVEAMYELRMKFEAVMWNSRKIRDYFANRGWVTWVKENEQ